MNSDVDTYELLKNNVVEIRFHGRGGQGAVTAATLLVAAALIEGKWGQAIPSFGAERRGAHVQAYARVAPRPLPLHSQVTRPHIVVVLDPGLLSAERDRVLLGLRENGVIVANLPSPMNINGAVLYWVDATQISRKLGLLVAGWPVVNTAMLGALAGASKIVSLNAVVEAIRQYWSARKKVAELNAEAARQAYNMIKKAVSKEVRLAAHA
ncbi:MAG: pyruvate ferredoxin oxidoreductase [Hyperthermus sp.]|nr:MAG: pyruvate ferredoxin oxidoreductase [Hyperthermus sp.]